MAECFKLHVHVALKHILSGGESKILSSDSEEEEQKVELEEIENVGSSSKSRVRPQDLSKKLSPRIARRRKRSKAQHPPPVDTYGEWMLDFEGPKLIEGIKVCMTFNQIIGQLNWIGKPLYFSIFYKIAVFSLFIYCATTRFFLKFYGLRIINENYRNPIFLFIGGMGCLTLLAQVIVSIRLNLFNLCPLYKILVTPKLCFVRREILSILGDQTLVAIMLGLVLHTLITSMAVSRDLRQFVNEFHIGGFMLDCYVNGVFLSCIIGMPFTDLYVRSAFGHWLLGLKSHLEHRFAHLHRYQRRKLRLLKSQGGYSSSESREKAFLDLNSSAEDVNESFRNEFIQSGTNKPPPRLVTFDVIQRNLNNMDDHLEVLRSVQISTMVLLTLNAFLVNGALFLLSYHLLADQHNLYHGFLFLLLSLECLTFVFLSYSGDRWVYYALSSFVQTVEDEYFMQSDIKTSTQVPNTQASGNTDSDALVQSTGATSNINDADFTTTTTTTTLKDSSINKRLQGHIRNLDEEQASELNLNNISANDRSALELELESSTTVESCRIYRAQQILFIRKKDVLFCREFLHQFENHLATPWSKLTFITHLHMARAFVTLIAAQIIFDHEH